MRTFTTRTPPVIAVTTSFRVDEENEPGELRSLHRFAPYTA